MHGRQAGWEEGCLQCLGQGPEGRAAALCSTRQWRLLTGQLRTAPQQGATLSIQSTGLYTQHSAAGTTLKHPNSQWLAPAPQRGHNTSQLTGQLLMRPSLVRPYSN